MNLFSTPAARRAITGTATVLAAVTGLGLALAGTAAASESGDTASISGRIWFDRDYDGVQDDGEPGYQRGGVVLLFRDNEQVGALDTDADGRFVVDGLAPGEYRVANMDNGVYYSTTAIYQDFRLSPGDAVTADFGIRGGSIQGEAWFDANGNHGRDDGEGAPDGAAGAGVHMIGPAGLELDTTLAEDGHYVFQDLPNGSNYQIVAPNLPGVEFLTMTNDSQINPTTGMSEPMSIWQGTDLFVQMGYAAAAADQADLGLGAMTASPDKKTYTVGETFTLTIPVTNAGTAADDFVVDVGYPKELVATKTAGAKQEFAENGSASFTSLEPLGAGSRRSP
jgi:SdrD B-like protein